MNHSHPERTLEKRCFIAEKELIHLVGWEEKENLGSIRLCELATIREKDYLYSKTAYHTWLGISYLDLANLKWYLDRAERPGYWTITPDQLAEAETSCDDDHLDPWCLVMRYGTLSLSVYTEENDDFHQRAVTGDKATSGSSHAGAT
ncbi:hypothetical protein M406DRAFT_328856 [Cryphonectria parasitica EP155]|uniref:Uncharacterized protein n=1 Tax=Cryphonectria parasitica (strain ATCC 38755 / EP155) TaxID=660469 RepID=A0A9P4Y7A0_CRYP1|nr:uncharacterized protein M406DRAFT_328856 [Cryphonectria parasitica EP155]KAF3767801.1 hypothetical protein M406DRAFT_328856 [Cryphonectria parasitica EP155]